MTYSALNSQFDKLHMLQDYYSITTVLGNQAKVFFSYATSIQQLEILKKNLMKRSCLFDPFFKLWNDHSLTISIHA